MEGDSKGDDVDKKARAQGYRFNSGFGGRRSKRLRDKKRKKYKEERKDESHDNQNDEVYGIEVEETLKKLENSATKEEFKVEA